MPLFLLCGLAACGGAQVSDDPASDAAIALNAQAADANLAVVGLANTPSDTLTLPAAAIVTALTQPLATKATLDAAASVSSAQQQNSAAWPFAMPSVAALRASPRLVFAHYFTPFPVSIDNLDPDLDYYTVHYLSPSGEKGKFAGSGGFIKQRPMPRLRSSSAAWAGDDMAQEIRRAAAAGLDGFSLDVLQSSGPHWQRALQLLDTANAVDTQFRVLLMPDMESEFKQSPDNLLPALRVLARHPAALRLADGRVVVSPYNAQNQSPAWWASLLASLKADGIQVALMPLFQGWNRYVSAYASISYGVSDWGVRSPGANRGWDAPAGQAHALGLKWMAPVAPQDSRPKDLIYWEARNSENYRTMWNNAIQGGADWVQVITWNDYSEGTEIAPSSGTQWSFYDLTAYYLAWFKTGKAPAVTQDALMYFHRRHATTARPSSAQTRPYTAVPGSDAPTDDIEVLTFATAPATLQIDVGGRRVATRDVPAGVSTVRVPLVEGTPAFTLQRNGSTVAAVQSAYPISNSITYQDMLYRSGASWRAPIAPR